MVNFSLNQPKYKSLLEYWKIRNDINSHDPSESGSNFRNPIQKESEYNRQLLKEFVPDMDMLGKEFNSEKNRVKREAYRANHTKEQLGSLPLSPIIPSKYSLGCWILMGGLLVSLTRAWWKRVSFWALRSHLERLFSQQKYPPSAKF